MNKGVKIIGLMSGIVLIAIGLFFLGMYIADDSFKLTSKYYGENKYIDLDGKTLDKIIKDKESFAVFVYQPMCAASSTLESVVTPFMGKYNLSLYKISYSDMKNTVLGKTIKYYPSIVIYEDGEIVDFLDANSGEDVDIYKTFDAFEKWFTSYVKVKENENYYAEVDSSEIPEDAKIDAVLEDVTYDNSKVNVYFFWGDGCPHCKQEFKYFDSIKEMYGDKYNLHTFEVWYNKENATLLKQFADKMGVKVDGIPFTIIADEVFIGFGDEDKAGILKAILTKHENSYDVYFDKEDKKEDK